MSACVRVHSTFCVFNTSLCETINFHESIALTQERNTCLFTASTCLYDMVLCTSLCMQVLYMWIAIALLLYASILPIFMAVA